MKCQQCSQAEATVHLKEVMDGKLQELHLCESCANEKGLHLVVEQNKLTIASQFIWMAENLYPESSSKVGAVQCSSCGLRYSQFSRVGRVGCPDCYDAFQPQLQKILLRVHGATRHKGRVPVSASLAAGDTPASPGSPETEDAGTAPSGSGPEETKENPGGSAAPGPDEMDAAQLAAHRSRTEEKLRRAIETEAYEEAARLRDELRGLEGGGQ